MKRALKVLMACLLAAAAARSARAGELNLFYGKRTVSDDFEPADDQKPYGLDWFTGGKDWPLSLVFGANRGKADGRALDPLLGSFKERASFEEVSAGVAKVFGRKTTRPYIGLGAAYLKAKLTLEAASLGPASRDDDRVLAPYWNAGAFWKLGNRFDLGVDLRAVTRANVTLLGSDADANYRQYSALAGWSW